ncbi:flagellar biosynthetic protein FliO [bacterium]|nr:flagellar biosynthetic protein FliO [bacterium]
MIKKLVLTFFVLCTTAVSFAEEAAVQTATITAEAPAAAVEAAVPVAQAPAEKAKLAEDQIPLLIEADKKNADVGSSTSKAMMSAVIILALLGTTYYFVRKYKISNTINKSNMQIKVLTQHYLGPKKSLAIIHVAGESILVGITDTNISMIKSLSLIDDEVPADMPKTFSESMNQKAGEVEPMVDELDEEFSFAGVTDTVSKKIKSMRSFS